MNQIFKQFLFTISVCIIVSAITAYFVYDRFDKKNNYQDASYAKLVGEKELVLSGSLRKYFHASSPNDFTSAAESAKSSVVGINTLQKTNLSKSEKYEKVTGSGVIISAQGHIVTNYHVIENTDEIKVLLDDFREYRADIVAVDPATDIAVLKIEGSNLSPAIFGNSDSLLVGEWVLAIGNPFKLQTTVTAGIISAKGRDIDVLKSQGIESFIQTDAAINPGNSGGALVNTNGEIIGINTAIMSETGRYEGFSFAIPINLVQKVVYDLMEYGAVQRALMGITIEDVDNETAQYLKLDNVSGIYVRLIESNSAAKLAGLKKGDVIVSVNDIATPRTPNFKEQIANYRPGDAVNIKYIRDKKEYTTEVILRNKLNTTDFISIRKDPSITELGFELRDLSTKELQILPGPGVYVVSIYRDSKIAETNMEPGFIITSINKKKISNAEDFINRLNNTSGQVILEGYYEHFVGDFPYTFFKQ